MGARKSPSHPAHELMPPQYGKLPIGGIQADRLNAPDDRPIGAPARWRCAKRRIEPDGRCHSGARCRLAAPEGRRFCQGHGDELARIRESFDAEEATLTHGGTWRRD